MESVDGDKKGAQDTARGLTDTQRLSTTWGLIGGERALKAVARGEEKDLREGRSACHVL